MFPFILTNVFLASVGVVLYVMARTLPRIEESGAEDKKGIFERWIASEIPEKFDAALNSFLFKFFRRAKVAVLKADNSISAQLQKMKPENGNGKAPAIDFKEISGQNKESEESKQ
jgi:hypothetical protein